MSLASFVSCRAPFEDKRRGREGANTAGSGKLTIIFSFTDAEPVKFRPGQEVRASRLDLSSGNHKVLKYTLRLRRFGANFVESY